MILADWDSLALSVCVGVSVRDGVSVSVWLAVRDWVEVDAPEVDWDTLGVSDWLELRLCVDVSVTLADSVGDGESVTEGVSV